MRAKGTSVAKYLSRIFGNPHFPRIVEACHVTMSYCKSLCVCTRRTLVGKLILNVFHQKFAHKAVDSFLSRVLKSYCRNENFKLRFHLTILSLSISK